MGGRDYARQEVWKRLLASLDGEQQGGLTIVASGNAQSADYWCRDGCFAAVQY